MKLFIENIGTIEKAEIELSDITVIAGENDSGKSTIGKIFFALIQAFANYPVMLRSERTNHIRRELERVFIELRRNFDLANFPDVRDTFFPPRINRRIELLDVETLSIMHEVLERLDAASPGKGPIIRALQDRLRRLERYTTIELSPTEAIGNAIFRSLQSEFCGELVNKTRDIARITVVDGESMVFEITLSDHEVLNFKGEDNIGLEDATFIDSPAVIQFVDSMSNYTLFGESYRSSSSLPFHTVDLMQKLRAGTSARLHIRPSSLNLSATYKGKMYFDSNEKNFFLDKGNYKVSSNNIASGVKSLGLLDILIEGGYVHEGSALILDEPETNLHPKWQVEYARILCRLANAGVKVLITTHSPYMVEVLKVLTQSEKIHSSFYMAGKNINNETVYLDASRDVSPIVDELAQPLMNFYENQNDDF